MGRTTACEIVIECKVESAALAVGTSVIEPWQFRMELKQQSGSDEEPGGADLDRLGQQV